MHADMTRYYSQSACADLQSASVRPRYRPRIRILLVNRSDAELASLRQEIEKDRDIEVIGMARNSHEARGMVRSLDPDLLIMDILDSQAGGIGFLRRLRRFSPRPVLLVSPFRKLPLKLAFAAFQYGAADIIDKDTLGLFNPKHSSSDGRLFMKIKAIAS